MAQTGFTPIQLYSTSTAAAAPVAGNLTNSTLGSELAINITDGKLFYKDNANAVQVIGWKTVPTTAGGTGLTTYTAGDLSYYASGTTFTKLAIGTIGQIITSTGSAPQWTTLSGVAVTTFSAGTTGFTPNSATSGAITLAGTLITSNGGTGLSSYTAGDLSYYASGTTLTKLAIGATGRFLSSTGSAPQWSAPAALTETDDTNVTMTLGGTPSTALLSSVSMTLGWTGTLAVSRGGTGTGTAFIAGSVIFAGASGTYSQDNGQLFYDNTNDRLGVGTSTPAQKLDVNGVGRFGSLATKINIGLNGDSISSDGDMYVQTSTSNFISLRTNFTEAIRLETNQNVKITNGNVVIATSGKGIDFSATAGAGTSELLADYEEGTWTPTITTSSGTITSYTSSGYYTKIGRQVTLNGLFTITNIGTGTGSIGISNLPFSIANAVAGGTARESAVNGLGSVIYQNSSTELFMRTAANGDPGATNASFQFSVTYFN
jgi:hypothetical protein